MNEQESDCFHFVSHEKHQTRSPHPSHLTFFNNEIYETEDDWCTDKTGAASFSFQGFGCLKSPLKKRMMTDKLPSGEDEVKLLFIQPAVFVCIEMSDEFSGLEMCDVFVE